MRPAELIIRKLGGVRTAARLLGKPPSTVQDWKRSGLIPAKHQAAVLQCAREAGLEVTAEDLIGSAPRAAAPQPQQAEAA
jgi:hypothetical protein